MQSRCPKRKECQCIFSCTYDREEGKDFNFTPKCFVEGEKSKPKSIKKKVTKVKPQVAQIIVNKSNIWDDIKLTT